MEWKQGFYESLRAYVGLPESAVIYDVEETVDDLGGEDTLSPEYEFSLDIWYTLDGVDEWMTVVGSLTEFIRSL